MKSIHILDHSISLFPGQYPEGDPLHYNSGIPMLFARAIRQYAPSMEIEVWRPERRTSEIYTWTDQHGVKHRVFPSRALRYKLEISTPLLQAVANMRQSRDTYFWMHGIYNLHSFLLASRLKDAAVIAQSHGGFPGKALYAISNHTWRKYLYLLLHPFEVKKLPQYPHIYAISSEERGYLLDLLSIPEQQVSVSPTGIDFAHFSPGNKDIARSNCGIDLDTEVVLYVGRLSEGKGIDDLITAFKQISSERKRAELFILGQGPLLNNLQAQVAAAGLRERVFFVGYISPDLLPDWYRAADVTVVPTFFEWFGKVSAESMACGTPVVVTKGGGGIDIVKEFECGVLVPLQDPPAISAAVISLLSGEVNRMPNIERARQTFDWSVKLSRSFELLSQLSGKQS